MKLNQIIEAQYYRRHTVKGVHDRLKNMAGTVLKGMAVATPEYPISNQNSVSVKIYIHNADSKQDAINQVFGLLQKYGVPYTDIGSIMSVSNIAWRVTMTYAPDRLTEAIYSGRWSVIDVANRLNHKFNRTENVKVIDVTIPNPDTVVARFNVVAYSRQDATNEVKRYLRKFGIPYTEFQDFQELRTNVWEVTMTYNPDNLTEARYYGKHSVEDVKDRYHKIAREYNAVENVRVLFANITTFNAVYVEIYIVDADSKHRAISDIEQFLEKYGLPYTEIREVKPYAQARQTLRGAWQAEVTYQSS